jgi:hypothetical protein
LIVFQALYAFNIERKDALGRPTSIREFIKRAIDGLDKDDCLHLSKAEAVNRIQKIFEKVGYKVSEDSPLALSTNTESNLDDDELCSAPGAEETAKFTTEKAKLKLVKDAKQFAAE